MPFNPKPEYTISPKLIHVGDFFHYTDEFVTRPPYQRKSVWGTKKKQALLDSLFRRYYIPKIVIREVRLANDRSVNEVVDGQQRIIVVQEFFSNKLKLPKSLSDVNADLPEKYHKDLSAEFKRFIDKELMYDADIVKGIDRYPVNCKLS
jgi:antitoxin component of MazEF toxin-antitoxin module